LEEAERELAVGGDQPLATVERSACCQSAASCSSTRTGAMSQAQEQLKQYETRTKHDDLWDGIREESCRRGINYGWMYSWCICLAQQPDGFMTMGVAVWVTLSGHT